MFKSILYKLITFIKIWFILVNSIDNKLKQQFKIYYFVIKYIRVFWYRQFNE